MFTVKQAAERLNCSTASVYSLISAGRVACHRIGLRRGAIRISQTQLEAFLDETKQERREENAHAPLPKASFKHLRA